MSPTLDAFLRSWPFEPWLLCSLLLTAGIYLRGWLALYRSSHNGGRVREAKPMTSGALRTEREVVAQPNSVLRRLRETRHFAGISVLHAPYSENSGLYRQNQQRWRHRPAVGVLHGIGVALSGPGVADRALRRASAASPHASTPAAHDGRAAVVLARRADVAAAPRSSAAGANLLGRARLALAGIARFFSRLTHPAAALTLFVAATWLWHVPAAYELVMRSSGWHYVQHACFLATGLLFGIRSSARSRLIRAGRSGFCCRI